METFVLVTVIATGFSSQFHVDSSFNSTIRHAKILVLRLMYVHKVKISDHKVTVQLEQSSLICLEKPMCVQSSVNVAKVDMHNHCMYNSSCYVYKHKLPMVHNIML